MARQRWLTDWEICKKLWLTKLRICKFMTLPKPEVFHHGFSNDRLQAIADHLLRVRHQTVAELSTDLDDNWVRETACFGRSRNLLISLASSRTYSWLGVTHAGMDVTPTIDGVPFRFFRDDAEEPGKAGFFRRNSQDNLFSDDPDYPVMWRFVIERAETEEDEDRVVFAGYNVLQTKVSEWTHAPGSDVLYSVGIDVPPAMPISPASVDVREDEAGQDVPQQAGNDK